MHGAEVLIPILVPLSFFAMVFGLYYIRSRENMAMIAKGMNPKEFNNRPAPYRNLKNGLLLLGAGTGLALAYFITQYVLHDEDNPALWFALIGIGGGIGLISSYRIEKKELLDSGQNL
jgi:4-amino-4-deoxy-L-arabinose transferase-like glycosyltransferase